MEKNAADLPEDVNQLKSIIYRLQRDVAYLEELVKLFQHKKFSSGSESNRHPGERCIFDEAEETVASFGECEGTEQEKPRPHSDSSSGRKSGRKPLPDIIPRVDRLIDLPEDQKFCPYSGAALRKVGEEISEQLDIVPAKLQVIRTIRPKYSCSCGRCGFHVASMPLQAIPKSMATPGLLAYIATAKYADALPLHRQEGILQRIGCDLPRATLASWMIKCGTLVTPVINLMREKLLEAPLVYCDETVVQVLKGTEKKPTSKSYMWVQAKWGGVGDRIVLYNYRNSRSGEIPLRLFEGYQGYVQTDGYDGYSRLALVPGIIHVGDWVHVRRKFHDVIKSGAKGGLASIALEYISALYKIELEIKSRSPDEIVQARQSRSKAVLMEMRAWADEAALKVPPKSLIGKAFSYFNQQWPKLSHFIDDAKVGLDTNAVERSIRPFAIGRKNWIFSDTASGAEASANLYSLIITAKANNLNPYEYLQRLFKEIPYCQSAEDFDRLMPW